MATTTIESGDRDVRSPIGARLDQPSHPAARLLFGLALLGGLGYAGYSIFLDTQHVGETLATGVFLFLALALVIALGFEFVNGFHDTANAVATVIYTNSMPAPFAVVWSGVWNLIGVLLSSGAVAYSIVTLLPVDLILHVGSNAGFAMIFALLLAAVIWNLATWYFGIPNSSSHALIGSILGVGFANQLLTAGTGGTQGVDWSQAEKVLSSLLFSPLVGFVGALVLLLVMKLTLRNPNLYKAPEGDTPPPTGIRALLIFTCTAVSFAHGGNDGQKGMGLIMLILIGCAPTAYALNRTMPASETPAFVQHATAAAAVFHSHAQGTPIGVEAARQALTSALKTRNASTPVVYAAIETVTNEISHDVGSYGSLSQIPSAAASNLRNDMYLVLDSSRMATKAKDANKTFSAAELKTVEAYQTSLEKSTRYIPLWVKVTVAIALGLGTMVGWRRIVVTVGERIGKTHLTYGMGAAAELTTAATIFLAEQYGVPVSTTHILTSGVAGASAANGAGLQRRTIINMALAWTLTLPAAMLIAGSLYWALLTAIRAMGTV